MATATEQTLVIIKPDAVQRGLVGEITARFERRGLKIVAMRFEQIREATAARHYAEHEGKPFYAGLVEYITSSPSLLMVLDGPDAIQTTRNIMGKTRPVDAELGTIRADFALQVGRNLVHGSDGPESAAREVALFFGDGGIVQYERAIDRWVLE
jgi:nucleoside-diphosphate kinase